jgi:hypothetical protein
LASWILGIAMTSLGIIKGWQPGNMGASNRDRTVGMAA